MPAISASEQAHSPRKLRAVDIAQVPGTYARLAEANTGREPDAAFTPQIAERRSDVAEIDVPQLTSARLAQARTEMPDHIALRLGARELGPVAVRISGQRKMAIALGDLVGLVGDRLPGAEFQRFSGSQAAAQFVDIDQLAEAGIALSYNAAYDELQLALH